MQDTGGLATIRMLFSHLRLFLKGNAELFTLDILDYLTVVLRRMALLVVRVVRRHRDLVYAIARPGPWPPKQAAEAVRVGDAAARAGMVARRMEGRRQACRGRDRDRMGTGGSGRSCLGCGRVCAKEYC